MKTRHELTPVCPLLVIFLPLFLFNLRDFGDALPAGLFHILRVRLHLSESALALLLQVLGVLVCVWTRRISMVRRPVSIPAE